MDGHMDITPIITGFFGAAATTLVGWLTFRAHVQRLAAERADAKESQTDAYDASVLRMASQQLEERIADLHTEVDKLRKENETLRANVAELLRANADLLRINAELRARVDALLAQLRGEDE